MIGAAALILWLGVGRIMGVSTIVLRAVSENEDRIWRVLFLLSMVAGGFAASLYLGKDGFSPIREGWIAPIIGGLLVGFGTGYGNGCTSGHGICGLGRRSTRSLVATCTFMASGILSVVVFRWLGV